MAQPLRIALAGLGTVGGGVIRLIEANGPLIAKRAGRRWASVALTAAAGAVTVDVSTSDGRSSGVNAGGPGLDPAGPETRAGTRVM